MLVGLGHPVHFQTDGTSVFRSYLPRAHPTGYLDRPSPVDSGEAPLIQVVWIRV